MRSPEGNRIGVFIVLHVALPWFAKRIAFLGARNQLDSLTEKTEQHQNRSSGSPQGPTGEVGGRLTNGNRSIRDATGPHEIRSILDATPHENRSAFPAQKPYIL